MSALRPPPHHESTEMPELPEVETVCRTLRTPLVGRSLRTALVTWPRTVEPLPADTFVDRVTGETVASISRRAKLIVTQLSSGAILTTHLRMTGKLLYSVAGGNGASEPERHLRVAFQLDNGDDLEFYDARKFGRMRLLSPDEWQAVSDSFGPEPLSPEFTAEVLYDRLQRTTRQLKPLLLDQAFVAGIGNIYADESLYLARIHPLKPASSISRRKAGDLHGHIVATLSRAIDNAGTTLRDYRSGLGEIGTNRASLNVYGAAPGTVCKRCGTRLKRLVVGQRGTTICPRCQRIR